MKIPRLLLALALGLLLAQLALDAQRFGGGWGRYPPRFPQGPPDGRFAFARLMYDSVRADASGSGWTTDYPGADINFMIRLSELTKTGVSMGDGEEPEPKHVVVTLNDDRVFGYPFLLASDVGTIGFRPTEITRLRQYLLKGGFLWVDDSWGPQAWEHWVRQIGIVLPPAEYPIVDVRAGHVLMKTMFDLKDIPQIPNISHWRRSGGETSERGSDSANVVFRAIADKQGRVMVLMSHNTDIQDGWEREGEDPEYFYRFSPDAYAVGINVALYSMTH